MAIITESGRIAVAASVKSQQIHMAWGTGDPLWDSSPEPEDVGATALLNEIGRRRVTQTLFCTPSPTGELIVPSGRFSVSEVPTKYIYLRFSFDFDDAPSETIRELGVFVGTQLKPGVPEDKEYVEPSEIESPGQLLVIEHILAMPRSDEVRQQFEFVIQF